MTSKEAAAVLCQVAERFVCTINPEFRKACIAGAEALERIDRLAEDFNCSHEKLQAARADLNAALRNLEDLRQANASLRADVARLGAERDEARTEENLR